MICKCPDCKGLETTLRDIEAMPFSMVNDSEGLRHTIRVMQQMARNVLARQAFVLSKTD